MTELLNWIASIDPKDPAYEKIRRAVYRKAQPKSKKRRKKT